jgi:hypothetical protein
MKQFKQFKLVENDVWKDCPEKIKVLNQSDFGVPSFIKNLSKHFRLDLDSLGLSNAEEIQARLDIMNVLTDSKVRTKVKELNKFFEKSTTLPLTENSFLFYYKNPDNPYWIAVKELISVLKPYTNYSRIKLIVDKLELSLPLEKLEKTFADDISQKLKDVTFLEGVIDMTLLKYDPYYNDIFRQVYKSVVVGKKVYRSTWKDGFVANVPKWTKTKFMDFFGLRKAIQKLANSFALHRANRSSVVTDLPACVVQDISSYFSDKQFKDVLDKYYDCIFTIHFEYTKDGLILDFVGIRKQASEVNFSFELHDFDGFTNLERRKFKKKSVRISEMYQQTAMIRGLQPIYDNLERCFRLFSSHFSIESSNTDENFRWYALQNIYNENIEIVDQLEDIRKYTAENVKSLNMLSNIYEYMKEIADKKGLDICIPELTATHSGTTFSNLAPIEIFDKDTKLIPFTLPTINGRILCLTGRHGGGKSVAGKSILNSVWIAQSGLPVFAKEFKTELKTAIGSIVNDEGEGSTANNFLDKVIVLLNGIGTVPKGESIIFIDEIGKGTSEAAGINLGKRILRTVKEKGYSVIFNSQILQLAEYAQNELDTKCFVVNKEHQFAEGIGDGQMEQIIKEKGLDKLLVK